MEGRKHGTGIGSLGAGEKEPAIRFLAHGFAYGCMEEGTPIDNWTVEYRKHPAFAPAHNVRLVHGSLLYLLDGYVQELSAPALLPPGDMVAAREICVPVREVAMKDFSDNGLVLLEVAAPATEFSGWSMPVGVSTPTKIFVDAGHGGADPGAVANEVLEKDVTLRVAQALASALERHPNISVRLSRSDDSYPTLADRTRMAQEWQADLFISLHCNSAPRTTASGVEIYVLGDLSSDKQAERLAEYENSVFAREAATDDGNVGMILADLQQQDATALSLQIASAVQRHVMPRWGGEQRSVRQAPFWVLRNASMPSMLVELGFVSNEEEARSLSDPGIQYSYGELLSEALIKALRPVRASQLHGQ